MMSITGPMRMRQEDGAEDRVGVREGWSDKDMPEDNIELGGRRKRRREGEIDAMTSEKEGRMTGGGWRSWGQGCQTL